LLLLFQSIAEREGTGNIPQMRVFINLTPFIPLSFKGEGEGFKKRGWRPSKTPLGVAVREKNGIASAGVVGREL